MPWHLARELERSQIELVVMAPKEGAEQSSQSHSIASFPHWMNDGIVLSQRHVSMVDSQCERSHC